MDKTFYNSNQNHYLGPDIDFYSQTLRSLYVGQ